MTNLHIAGTFHPVDERFNVQFKGKQCAFKSLLAVLRAYNIPVIDWLKTTLDNVLRHVYTLRFVGPILVNNNSPFFDI